MKYSTLATSLGNALCLSLCPLAAQEQETAAQPEKIYVLNTETLTSEERMSLIREELDEFPLPSSSGDELKAALQQFVPAAKDMLANSVGKLNAAQIRRIEQRAASGHTEEQTTLAVMHMFGEGVEPDVGKSINLFATAARSGDKDALAVLGCLYAMGDFGEDYFRLGMLMLEQAAVEGSSQAMYHLSFINLMTGDFDKANYWYQKVVSEPDFDKLKQAFVMISSSLRNAAKAGDVDAQVALGLFYYYGMYGVEENNAEALKWFLSAANQGNVGAQLILGSLYEDGEIVPRDLKQAAYWYSKAANQGDEEAKQALEELKAKTE